MGLGSKVNILYKKGKNFLLSDFKTAKKLTDKLEGKYKILKFPVRIGLVAANFGIPGYLVGKNIVCKIIENKHSGKLSRIDNYELNLFSETNENPYGVKENSTIKKSPPA